MSLTHAEKKSIKDELLRVERTVHKTLMDLGMTRLEAAKAIRWTGHVLENEVDDGRDMADTRVVATVGGGSGGDAGSGDTGGHPPLDGSHQRARSVHQV